MNDYAVCEVKEAISINELISGIEEGQDNIQNMVSDIRYKLFGEFPTNCSEKNPTVEAPSYEMRLKNIKYKSDDIRKMLMFIIEKL